MPAASYETDRKGVSGKGRGRQTARVPSFTHRWDCSIQFQWLQRPHLYGCIPELGWEWEGTRPALNLVASGGFAARLGRATGGTETRSKLGAKVV